MPNSKDSNFKLALQGTNSGLWDLNLITMEVYFSPEWKSMLGYEDSDLENSFATWQNLMHPDDKERSETFLSEFLGGVRSQFKIEFRLKEKSGDFRWILSQAAPTFNDQGKMIQLTGIHIDIQEQKVKNLIFEQIIKTIGEVFWMMDPTTHQMVYISPAYENIWGRSCESLYQNPESYIEGIHPDDRSRIAEKISKQLDQKYDVDYRVLRPDGSIRWVNDRSYTVRDSNQKILNVVGVATDITSQKEALNEIEELRVKAFSHSKMAALGEMAGGVAHEINNPLTIIFGNVSTMKKILSASSTPDIEKFAHLCERIEVTALRISKIIKGLKSFSRSGETVEKEIFKITDLYNETESMCGEKFKAHGTKITFSGSQDLTVYGNLIQIEQVLINLINNAFDAIREFPNPWINVSAIEQNQDFIEIRVTDCGNGIPKEIASKMMEPFYTTKEVGKGTGLGLSISQGIITDHGGSLTIDDQAANTTFVVVLPKKKVLETPVSK